MKTLNKLILALSIFLLTGVNVSNAQCQASYTYVDNGSGVIFFTNTSTGNISNVFWSFSDGSNDFNNNPIHTFINGWYEVCLTIDDSVGGCTSTFCDSIEVTSGLTPCNLSASFTYIDNGNGNFSFTNTSGSGLDYYWNFDNLYGFPYATSSIENPTYTYLTPGTYYVSLSIYDSLNSCYDSIAQQIVFQDSIACDIVAGFTIIDNGNGNFSFINTSTSGSTLLAQWNFGDGGSSNTYNANHTFTANGTFVVVLAAIGADSNLVLNNCIDYYTATITVTGLTNPVACNAAFVMYTDSTYNGVTVVNSSTGNNLTYFWDFGDGNTSTQAYPSYTYATAGPFELCLTVSGDSNCTSTYCDSISSGGIIWKTNGFSINVVAPTTVGINDKIELIAALEIYPNPVKSQLNIELKLTEQTTVEVFVTDLLGKTVAQIANEEVNVGVNKFQWNTNNTKNGIYLLNIVSNNSRQVKKILVNR